MNIELKIELIESLNSIKKMVIENNRKTAIAITNLLTTIALNEIEKGDKKKVLESLDKMKRITLLLITKTLIKKSGHSITFKDLEKEWRYNKCPKRSLRSIRRYVQDLSLLSLILLNKEKKGVLRIVPRFETREIHEYMKEKWFK